MVPGADEAAQPYPVDQDAEKPVSVRPESIDMSVPTHMSDELREEFKGIKVSEEQVRKLAASDLTTWQITEQIYQFPFVHKDTRTWLFYQKVRRLINAKSIEVATAKPTRQATVCPHCGKQI
jgi:hypothetical protein